MAKLYKIKFKYKDKEKGNSYFVVNAKNARQANSLLKKAVPEAEIKSKPIPSTEKFIKDSQELKAANIDFNVVPIKKRYRNDKGQLISTRDVENIRQFYKENFTEEERSKINLYEQVKRMDQTTIKQTSAQGANLFISDPIMYVGFSEMPTSQIDYNQKLSAAKKMNTTLLYKGERVTQGKMIDMIEAAIRESKEKHLKKNDRYYRTYIFLVDDAINNTLNFDPDIDKPVSH